MLQDPGPSAPRLRACRRCLLEARRGQETVTTSVPQERPMDGDTCDSECSGQPFQPFRLRLAPVANEPIFTFVVLPALELERSWLVSSSDAWPVTEKQIDQAAIDGAHLSPICKVHGDMCGRREETREAFPSYRNEIAFMTVSYLQNLNGVVYRCKP